MQPATLVLVIAGAVLAFLAGSAWRHNRRTWADHRGAKAGEKALRKLRWFTLKAALAAGAATLLYLVATGSVAIHGSHQVPARDGTPSPTASTRHR
jgi:heme/copper-type cytochrome/quinol oxidase subunit 2